MSVTIKPSPHGANDFKPTGASVLTARDLTGLLKGKDKTKDDDKTSAEAEVEVGIKGDGIIQTSFQNITSKSIIYAMRTGFPDAAVKCYNGHQHLEIRPDDMGSASTPNSTCVSMPMPRSCERCSSPTKGRKTSSSFLATKTSTTITPATHRADWGAFAFKMMNLIVENIKDPSEREWM
jgi:hypothetical protein